jgi:hypothetical protein
MQYRNFACWRYSEHLPAALILTWVCVKAAMGKSVEVAVKPLHKGTHGRSIAGWKIRQRGKGLSIRCYYSGKAQQNGCTSHSPYAG